MTRAGEALAAAAVDPSPPPGLAGIAEALATEILFGSPEPSRVEEATREAAAALSLTALDASLLLHRLVARDPLFLRAEPAVAIDAQLRALLAFAPLTHVSLWLGGGSAPPMCAASAGAAQPRRPVRAAATHALRDRGAGAPSRERGDIRTMNVRVDEGRCILVLRTRRGKARAGLAHAAETATALAAVLERRLLLDRALHSNAQMLAAVDRRVTRLGFDLHDGPLQGVALISGELEHLNRQLALLVADDNARAVARRRVTDLADIAAEVACELRELARAAGGKGGEPLGSQLERCADDLGRRFGIGVELAIDGDVDRITESQRIAVARVVEEALANVGEHSGAGRAGVVVRRGPDGIHLVVEDDGKGFDVSRARTRAASEGRLGLQSMHERIRMLGGSLDISSRRGGPTVVTAVLPAWDGR